MGTRANFYVGRGSEAEWLGSIAWDGYPDGVFDANRPSALPMKASEDEWRSAVAEFLAQREDGTLPEHGWPWPWDDSGTTDYAYALDDGVVYASGFGYGWFAVAEGEPRDEDDERDRSGGKTAVFPDMRERKNFTMGTRSGVMVIGAQGPIPGEQIDAEEAERADKITGVGESASANHENCHSQGTEWGLVIHTQIDPKGVLWLNSGEEYCRITFCPFCGKPARERSATSIAELAP